jgi:hypothetical protein
MLDASFHVSTLIRLLCGESIVSPDIYTYSTFAVESLERELTHLFLGVGGKMWRVLLSCNGRDVL